MRSQGLCEDKPGCRYVTAEEHGTYWETIGWLPIAPHGLEFVGPLGGNCIPGKAVWTDGKHESDGRQGSGSALGSGPGAEDDGSGSALGSGPGAEDDGSGSALGSGPGAEDGALRCYAGNGKDIIQVTVDSFTAAAEPKPFHVSDSLSRLLRQCDGSTDFCVTIAAVEAVANDIEVPSGNGDGGGSGEEQPGQFEWAR